MAAEALIYLRMGVIGSTEEAEVIMPVLLPTEAAKSRPYIQAISERYDLAVEELWRKAGPIVADYALGTETERSAE